MRHNSIFTVAIFCATFLLYAKTIGFDFSYMDDNLILITNKAYFEAKDIGRVFTTDAFLENHSSYYRPLQSLSFMVDVVISGGVHPWIFHLTNIILFGIIGCLLFLLLLKCRVPQKISFIGSLMFCFHPLFVAAVAWIPARGDLLLTIFCLLLFICLIKYLDKGKVKYLFLIWLTFTLALFCKESAALLPLLFCVYFITQVPFRKIGQKETITGILLGCSFIIWVYLRSIYTSSEEQITMIRLITNLLTIPVAFSQLILFPVDFSPLPVFTPTKIGVGLLVIMALFIIGWKKGKQTFQERWFFILWFLLFLFPSFLSKSNVDQFDYLDHRFLLPMIGIFIFVCSLFSAFVITTKETKLFHFKTFIWAGILLALGICSFFKTDIYNGPNDYYSAVIKYNEKNVNAYNVRGLIRFENEDFINALHDFNQAIKIDSEFAVAYHNRGLLKVAINDLTGAMDDFNRALLLNQKEAKIYYARGCLKGQTGDLAGAIDDLDEAIILNLNYTDAYVDRAVAKGKMGNIYDAIADLDSAIEIDPNHKNAYINRAMAYYLLNDYEKALHDCETILKIDPQDESAFLLKNQILYSHDE